MRLYHYTSLEAAVNIIKNGLCFWGFRYDSMNDPTDCIFAENIIIPQLQRKLPKEETADVLNVYPYVVSFCKKGDYDLMWRLYRAEVALVIDSNKFPYEKWDEEGDISDTIRYGDVMYATEKSILSVAGKLYKNRKEIIEGIGGICDEYRLSVIPFIKHKSYEVEKEYRLTKIDYEQSRFLFNKGNPSNPKKIITEIPKDIKFFGVKDGQMRLYKEFQLPKECLVGIIFHTFDKKKFEKQKKHFELWLEQNGFDSTNITIEQTKSYPVR